MKQNAKYLGQK